MNRHTLALAALHLPLRQRFPRGAPALRCVRPQTLWLGIVLPVLAAGCQVQSCPAPPAPTAQRPQPTAEQLRAARVEGLLLRAERAVDEGRLTQPPADNAHDAYRSVLALAPDNADARNGLERIVEQFIETARRAIDEQRWNAAEVLLGEAAAVDAEHPGLPSMRSQLNNMRRAERRHLDLAAAAVREQRPAAAAELAAFGALARSARARVVIRAGSDAQGRWMYEQLNRAPGERRIRGEIEIGSPPRVTLMILPAGA